MTKKILRKGLIKRIHVDRHRMATNKKHGSKLPVLTVQARGGPYKSKEVIIGGPSRLVYSPDKPLSCGATLFIMTSAEVTLLGAESRPKNKTNSKNICSTNL